ncbi:hypothetical protein C0992_008246 [Termitomyces sp. T32_za158]|nr:hypothetical protein C0992_008246 [Termitomyces sp. T32_za158]
MSHLSPASLLVWATIVPMVGIFFLFHLWSFDRFKCLKWDQSVAFKRVLTYLYMLTIPLLAVYPVGLSAIKYHEGFIDLPPYGVIPKPIELWSPHSRSFYFPLTMCLSVGWSLEMVAHLEELCFWLFLLNSQQNWFRSLYFKTWVTGSILAITYMPIVTVLTRSDPLKRREGVDKNIIARLTKFSELNTIRIFFRFFFTLPPVILGIDGIRPHPHVNESMFWTDILVMFAGFGCAISSSITLVIFFPRSIKREIAAREERERSNSRNSDPSKASFYGSRDEFQHSARTFDYKTPVPGSKLLASSPRTASELKTHKKAGHNHPSVVRAVGEPSRTGSTDKFWDEKYAFTSLPPLRPNRKNGDGVEFGGIDQVARSNMARPIPYTSNVNHLVYNFTSPIGTLALFNFQPLST